MCNRRWSAYSLWCTSSARLCRRRTRSCCGRSGRRGRAPLRRRLRHERSGCTSWHCQTTITMLGNDAPPLTDAPDATPSVGTKCTLYWHRSNNCRLLVRSRVTHRRAVRFMPKIFIREVLRDRPGVPAGRTSRGALALLYPSYVR